MFLSGYKHLLVLVKPFLERRYLKFQVDSGGCELSILAQTGFVKSGSDLECLHASVGENIEMYEYQKETFFFCFMAVLLSEAQTEIPVSLYITRIQPSSMGELFWRCNYAGESHYAWEGNNLIHIKLILPILCLTSI